MKMLHLILPLAGVALLVGGCQPDANSSGDPRVDGIGVTPPAEPDLSILQDQRHSSAAHYTPSVAAPVAPETGPAATEPTTQPTPAATTETAPATQDSAATMPATAPM